MSLIILGPLVGHLKKKTGTVVFRTVQSNVVMRKQYIPVYPTNTSLINQRSLFLFATKEWKKLSDSLRIQWNNLAKDDSLPPLLKGTLHPSGFNLYCSCYTNSILIRQGIPLVIPNVVNILIPTVSDFFVVEWAGGLRAHFIISGAIITGFIFQATYKCSNGLNKGNIFHYVKSGAGYGAVDFACGNYINYGYPNNTPTEGLIFFRVRVIQTYSMMSSPWYYYKFNPLL